VKKATVSHVPVPSEVETILPERDAEIGAHVQETVAQETVTQETVQRKTASSQETNEENPSSTRELREIIEDYIDPPFTEEIEDQGSTLPSPAILDVVEIVSALCEDIDEYLRDQGVYETWDVKIRKDSNTKGRTRILISIQETGQRKTLRSPSQP